MKLLVALGKRLNNDGSFHAEMLERCNSVLEGLREGQYDIALLSGGLANPRAGITEAEAMRDYLVLNGIKKEKLVMEKQSKTTLQNAKFCKDIIKSLSVDRIYLCSSRAHLRRPILNPVRLFRHYLGKDIEIISVVAGR